MGTWPHIEEAICITEETCGMTFGQARDELDQVRELVKSVNGMRLQHASDSRELRRLCSERDKYRDMVEVLNKSRSEMGCRFEIATVHIRALANMLKPEWQADTLRAAADELLREAKTEPFKPRPSDA